MKILILTILVCFGMTIVAKAQKGDTLKAARDTAKVKTIADGSSYDRAIVIMAKSEMTGTTAEYAWLRKNYPGYKTKMQSLNYYKKKPYDILHVVLADGMEKAFYFDISNFFGKF